MKCTCHKDDNINDKMANTVRDEKEQQQKEYEQLR